MAAISLSTRARWLVILLVVILDGIGLAHFRMHLSIAGAIAALIVFGVLGTVYTKWRPDERVADLAQCAAQIIALFAACGAFMASPQTHGIVNGGVFKAGLLS